MFLKCVHVVVVIVVAIVFDVIMSQWKRSCNWCFNSVTFLAHLVNFTVSSCFFFLSSLLFLRRQNGKKIRHASIAPIMMTSKPVWRNSTSIDIVYDFQPCIACVIIFVAAVIFAYNGIGTEHSITSNQSKAKQIWCDSGKNRFMWRHQLQLIASNLTQGHHYSIWFIAVYGIEQLFATLSTNQIWNRSNRWFTMHACIKMQSLALARNVESDQSIDRSDNELFLNFKWQH